MVELTLNCFFAIQSVLSINMKSPITKLLVLTNQSPSGSLIYFPYSFDNQRSKCANIYETFLDIYFSEFSSFILKVPVEKSCYKLGRTSWY